MKVLKLKEYKKCQASDTERTIAAALYKKQPKTKAIIHFDSNSCSSIDGEWSLMVLKFENHIEYRMKPFFAYEDCV